MGYGRLTDHRTMVFDEVRNDAWRQALQRLVTPDSVVLDLGAGAGILGLLAAKAGAKRVYCVEPSPVVNLVRELAVRNGVEDRIVILQGCIEDIVLPEQVDLLLSVFTGNLLFSEDLLPSLFHARDRWLKPGGRLLPDLAELWLAPVQAPDLHAEYVQRWSAPTLGLDLAPARRFAANEIVWLPRKSWSGTLLSAGACMAGVNLAEAHSADCQATSVCHADRSGLCHGLLGWIRFRVGDTWLSTDPASPAMHWNLAVLPLDPPLPLTAGERLALTLQRPAGGDWSWNVAAAGESRRHSEFLARFDGLERMRRLMPTARPGLDERGRATLLVLDLLQRGAANQDIADSLRAAWPQRFADSQTALGFVQQTVAAHTSAASPPANP